jgi:hypothetical protein
MKSGMVLYKQFQGKKPWHKFGDYLNHEICVSPRSPR